VRPGETITVSAPVWYAIEGELGADCSGLYTPDAVVLTWVQGDVSIVVADQVPVSDAGFSATVTIPTTAAIGPAVIEISPGSETPDGQVALTVRGPERSVRPSRSRPRRSTPVDARQRGVPAD
jgi:hypothetical protein